MKPTRIITLFIATLGLAAGVARAEPGWGGAEGCGHGGWMQKKPDPERMARFMDWRAKKLHDALKLTPAQEPAWQAYLDKAKPQPGGARPDFEALAKLPTPERLDRMLALGKERQERMAARAAATKEFYAQLSPEQQKVFDDEAMRRPGRGPMGKNPRGGRPMPDQAPARQ